MTKHYSSNIPNDEKELIIEALQRLYSQRIDVINTVNDDKAEITVENWALGARKISDILKDFGAAKKI